METDWRIPLTNSAVMTDNELMTESSEESDDILLKQFCAGSEDAAERLFARYGDRLHEVAERKLGRDLLQRVDADDIVQSIFRTFFRRAINGDYQVPEGEELWKLLLVIGLNKVKGQAARHRAQRRDVSRSSESDFQLGFCPTTDESGFHLLKMAVGELVGTLPQSHGQIVRLRIEGYEVREIADTTERSRRTVERVLQQFRSHLREMVWPEHDEE